MCFDSIGVFIRVQVSEKTNISDRKSKVKLKRLKCGGEGGLCVYYFQEEREGPFLLLFVSCFAGNQGFSRLATDVIQGLLVKDESKRPEGTQKMGRKTAVSGRSTKKGSPVV